MYLNTSFLGKRIGADWKASRGRRMMHHGGCKTRRGHSPGGDATSLRMGELRQMTVFEPTAIEDGPPNTSVSRHSGPTARSVLRAVQVRLRIPAVLLISALVVGRWEVIRNYWDRLTRFGTGRSVGSGRLERHRVFLPDGPGRAVELAGEVRDLQHGAWSAANAARPLSCPTESWRGCRLSPYRIQLAGIKTATIGYQPLDADVRDRGHGTPRAE